MPVRFFEENIKAGFKDRRRLSGFIEALARFYLKEIKTVNLNYIFCNDEFLLHINRQYLNHDTLTDIITFDLSENKESLTGEIYISVERVKENAAIFKTNYPQEIHRVIFHGALHLCGFKDKDQRDKETMRAKEDEWLAKYFEQV